MKLNRALLFLALTLAAWSAVAQEFNAPLAITGATVVVAPGATLANATILVEEGRIAAVGADSQGKQELDPALVASATLVVDVLHQCAEIGELQHALAAGLMTSDDVHAELADVVIGRRPGRTRPDEITVFDSSGTALQDVAAALAVYDRARAAGRGVEVSIDV